MGEKRAIRLAFLWAESAYAHEIPAKGVKVTKEKGYSLYFFLSSEKIGSREEVPNWPPLMDLLNKGGRVIHENISYFGIEKNTKSWVG